MDDFAQTLVTARERAGLTQAQVAQAAGLTPSYLSFIENRKKPPPSDDACGRLAAVLGLDARALVDAAHLERAPETLRAKVRTLDSTLRRERKSRKHLLQSLLSPFLFAGPPGYLDSAIDRVGVSPKRRKRLRETLRALDRHDFDRADDVTAILDTMPEHDRELLLEALPSLLSARNADVSPTSAAREQLPDDAAAPFWLVADEPFERDGIEWRAGDRLLVDPGARAETGDVVVQRGPDGARFYVLTLSGDAKRPHRLGGDTLIRRDPPHPALDATQLRRWIERECTGVVTEVRRSLRRRGMTPRES